jgi:hypothetical protein
LLDKEKQTAAFLSVHNLKTRLYASSPDWNNAIIGHNADKSGVSDHDLLLIAKDLSLVMKI